jgi:hypothetical protein
MRNFMVSAPDQILSESSDRGGRDGWSTWYAWGEDKCTQVTAGETRKKETTCKTYVQLKI